MRHWNGGFRSDGPDLAGDMADHGFSVAGYDKDPAKIAAFHGETDQQRITADGKIEVFINRLRKPRTVILLVPAGPAVDAVIREMLPHLDPGDLIIDSGNSFYKDTDLRQKTLAEKKILFMGMGISGGEHGARFGPSLMPGGPQEAYARVQTVLEAAYPPKLPLTGSLV